METHKGSALKNVLIVIATCAFGLVLFWAVAFGPRFSKLGKEAQQRQTHLLCETDYQALLKACREVSRMVAEGKLNKYEYHIRGNPDIETSRFPKPILDLEPSYIQIGKNGSVMIELMGGLDHFGVKAYPENYGKPPSGRYGDRKLIEGLWYYDNGYKTNPDYDKTINKIIQKGRKR
jgi:hypothetical protein